MKKILILLLFLSVGFSQQIIHTETYENGNIKGITYHKKTSDRVEKVKYEGYHKNGQKKEEGTYKDGKWDGPYKTYYDNGQPKEEGTVKRGKWDGPYKTYYDNGQIKQEGTYKDGKMDGLMTWWYKTGQKTTEKIYKDGEEISEKERINPRRWR